MIDYTEFWGKENYIDATIPREKWLDTEMTKTMKERFIDNYRSSRILYSNDDLQIVEVMIRRPKRDEASFADLLHRAMPHDVLLIENYNNEWYKLSVTQKHTNKQNSYRKVVDNRISSLWAQEYQLTRMLREMSITPYSYQEYRFIIEMFNAELGDIKTSSCENVRKYEYGKYDGNADEESGFISRMDRINDLMYSLIAQIEDELSYNDSDGLTRIMSFLESIEALVDQFVTETELSNSTTYGVDPDLFFEDSYDSKLILGGKDYWKIQNRLETLVSEVNAEYECLINDMEYCYDYCSEEEMACVRSFVNGFNGLIEYLK